MMPFSSWQYFRAMAPIDHVIDAFLDEEKTRLLHYTTSDRHDVWSVHSQRRFANMIASSSESKLNGVINKGGEEVHHWDSIQLLPSKRYVRKLVMRYNARLEMATNAELEDDNLANLIGYLFTSSSRGLSEDALDPSLSCIVTYRVPPPLRDAGNNDNPSPNSQIDDSFDNLLLNMRIYPHHNDVGVAKVWEAGAALSEYIIHNPHVINGRHVVELGAGVGFTGLIAAACCGAKSVHMTDYTVSTLLNLAYNVDSNQLWLQRREVDPNVVSVVSMKESST